VLVVVEQALGDVERGDVVALRLFGEDEDEFVADAALRVGGLAADGFEALEQVVGGERGVFEDADHAFAAEHHGAEVNVQERPSTTRRIFYTYRYLSLKKPSERAYSISFWFNGNHRICHARRDSGSSSSVSLYLYAYPSI